MVRCLTISIVWFVGEIGLSFVIVSVSRGTWLLLEFRRVFVLGLIFSGNYRSESLYLEIILWIIFLVFRINHGILLRRARMIEVYHFSLFLTTIIMILYS